MHVECVSQIHDPRCWPSSRSNSTGKSGGGVIGEESEVTWLQAGRVRSLLYKWWVVFQQEILVQNFCLMHSVILCENENPTSMHYTSVL